MPHDLAGYQQRGMTRVPGMPYGVPKELMRARQNQQDPRDLAYLERSDSPLRRLWSNAPWIERTNIDEMFRRIRDLYKPKNWVFQFTLAAGGASGVARQQTGIDAWFLVTHITNGSTGLYTFQVEQTENGEQLFPTAIRNDAGAGTGANPFYLAEPWIVKGTLQVSVTDVSGAANAIWYSLCGIQVYPAMARSA